MFSARQLLIGGLAATACAAGATPATAATVDFDGSTLTYRAAPGETNNVGPWLDSWKEGYVRLRSGYGVTFTSIPAHCDDERANGDYIACPRPAALRFELGDGDDHYSSSTDMPADLPVTVDAGAGNDLLEARDAADTLLGGDGSDRLSGWKGADVLDGGAGEDVLSGYAGADRLSGGDGNDKLHPDDYQDPSADVVDGGAGVDTIESDYSHTSSSDPAVPVAFTFGGGADDGRPGEGDDVQGVERLILSTHGRIVGTDGPEYVKLHQVGGNGDLVGNGGDDELRGGDGADRVDGGTGNDLLDGGFGDDVITGGPGTDRISADLAGGDCGPLWCKLPYGNDTVEARDGEVDSVDCGAGQDVVRADANDVVAPNCETVERAGAAGGPAPGAGGGKATPGGTPGTQGGGGASRVTVVGGRRLRTVLAKGLTLAVPGLRARGRVELLHGRRAVARGTARTANRVTVKFTKTARRSLRGKRSVTLTVVAPGVRQAVTLRR